MNIKQSDKEKYLEEFRSVIEKKVKLRDEEWEEIRKLTVFRSFKKGATVVSEHDVEQWISYVGTGFLRGYFLKEGIEHTIAFTYSKNYCASLGSFVSRRASKYYIEALSDVVLLSISYDNMQLLYDQFKSVERWGRLAAEEVLTGFEWRQAELMSFTAEERYQLFVARSPELIAKIPQKYLASYLGMTPETFSRLRKLTLKNS
ncbi:MAG: cyclic nucleotide-binding domain-containing protein [Flavobacteriales bacterium]|nr:cyclic nucleotide-binding domain-containing protein [Flavobacteriales bacterium]